MKTALLLPLLLAASALRAETQPPAPATPGDSATRSESVSKSESSSSSASSSSQAIVNGKGKGFAVTRQKDANGKETVTVTTLGKNGKPKVETLTPEEFEKKYGERRRKRPAPADTPSQPKVPDSKETDKQPVPSTGESV